MTSYLRGSSTGKSLTNSGLACSRDCAMECVTEEQWRDSIVVRKIVGAFAKLRIATISFVMYVLSVRLEQLGSHWTGFDDT